MPPFGPIGRRELIAVFRSLGFEGPFAGGKHQFMRRDNTSVRIPNPHRGDISPGLLARVLRQAGVSREDWKSV